MQVFERGQQETDRHPHQRGRKDQGNEADDDGMLAGFEQRPVGFLGGQDRYHLPPV